MRADTETFLSCNLQYNTTHAAPYRDSLLKMRKWKQKWEEKTKTRS